jgi:hypothetical protein
MKMSKVDKFLMQSCPVLSTYYDIKETRKIYRCKQNRLHTIIGSLKYKLDYSYDKLSKSQIKEMNATIIRLEKRIKLLESRSIRKVVIDSTLDAASYIVGPVFKIASPILHAAVSTGGNLLGRRVSQLVDEQKSIGDVAKGIFAHSGKMLASVAVSVAASYILYQ